MCLQVLCSTLLLGGCLSAALLTASRCSPLPTKVRAILQSARQRQPLCASTFFPFLLPPTFQKPKRCCANAIPPPSPRPSRVFEAAVPLDQLHLDASDPCAQGRCSPRPAAPRRTLSFSSSVLFWLGSGIQSGVVRLQRLSGPASTMSGSRARLPPPRRRRPPASFLSHRLAPAAD